MTRDNITELLTPYLGPHMARAAVDAHAERIGFGLHLFVGKEKPEPISGVRRLQL